LGKNISEKVLQDLEFTTVLQRVGDFCISELGKEKVLSIRPFGEKDELLTELNLTDEYLASFQNDNRIPNHVIITSMHKLSAWQ
jgi:DNA mismatch repair protein MutS2